MAFISVDELHFMSITGAWLKILPIYTPLHHIRRIFTYIYVYVCFVYDVYNPRLVLAARSQVGFHFITCHSIDLNKTKTQKLFNL